MKLKLFFGGAVFVVFLSLASTQFARAAYRDDFPSFDGILIDQSVTWTKNEPHTIDKEVRIVDDAKLVIEPGAHIVFKGVEAGQLIPFMVINGSIEAIGTVAEPIFFERESEADNFYIHFSDESGAQSIFKNIRIIDGGKLFDNGNPQTFFKNFFVNKAFAAGEGMASLIYASGKLTVEDSVFSDSYYADVFAYDSKFNDWTDDNGVLHQDDSLLFIKNSDFNGNKSIPAIRVEDSACSDSDIACPRKITFENNWYGAESGPKMESNPSGTGKEIIGIINFQGWSGHPNICVVNCYSNVMFLPGLEASRLYADSEMSWEPLGDSDVEKLFLNSDGKSQRSDITTKGVIDNAYMPVKGNIYKSFLEDLERWKTEERLISDYAAVPYDWRLSLEDILNNGIKNGDNISYLEKADDPYIIQVLRNLAQTSKSKKVTLVAHSNGGLVAKALVNKLGAEAAGLIDKIVLVAVPQSGTAQAIGALLHGYDQGLPINLMPFFLSRKTAREMAQNMPGAYPLLPSQSYFSGYGSGTQTPPIVFKEGLATNAFISQYGTEVENYSELQSFLLDNNGKVSADSNDIVSPAIVNSGLFASGKDTHQTLDSLTIPESISVYQIAGFGEETLGTIRYWTDTYCAIAANDGRCVQYQSKIAYTPELLMDGDGTVVAPSALMMNTSVPNVMRYWVDLNKYDTFFRLQRKHADILEVPSLRNFIKDNILIQSSVTLPEFISDSEPPMGSEKRLRYYLHSPLALSIRDDQGHETGVATSDIPGAYYRRFGEVQYVSVPASVHPTLILDGEDNGSFTLEIKEMAGETVVTETTFAGIPSTGETKVSMDFPDGTLGSAAPLKIDYDGNGTDDHELKPILGGTVTLGQETDITSPEVKIFFNQDAQKLEIAGVDASSDASVDISELPQADKKQKYVKMLAKLTDKNDNNTQLVFEKIKDRQGFARTRLFSLGYGGNETALLNTGILYRWPLGESGEYRSLEARLKIAGSGVQSRYIPKKNETWLWIKESGKKPEFKKLSGRVVPYLESERGNIKVKY